jgi:flagellar hook-associated protein 1 FlgK
MASLNSVMNHALAGLTVSTAQSALVSRNISSSGDENYTRRTAEIHTLPGGAPCVSDIKRSADRQVLDKLLLSNSESAGNQIILDAIAKMAALSGDPEDGQSIAAAIGELQQALRGYEANPSSNALGRTALEAARVVALKLNAAAAEALSIRTSADSAMLDATERINNLLAQFKVVNDSIVRGEGTPDDLADDLDQRDRILKLLSEDIGIRTSTRLNNDMLIFTESGAVLFEATPRAVSFAPTSDLQQSLPGHPVYIDGVTVTGDSAAMRITGGRIAALSTVRDVTAIQFSLQMDQIAAGLIRGFAEKAPAGAVALPDVEGLFTGSGILPSTEDVNAGLSSLIRINTLADPDMGGSVSLLRDGGFGGPSYLWNTRSQAGYQARLTELSDSIDDIQSFHAVSGVGGSLSLKELGLQSESWVSSLYHSAQSSLDVANAKQSRAGDALSRMSGVSIDQEMASLLDLEKSYQASSKVLAVVNGLMSALIEAIG